MALEGSKSNLAYLLVDATYEKEPLGQYSGYILLILECFFNQTNFFWYEDLLCSFYYPVNGVFVCL